MTMTQNDTFSFSYNLDSSWKGKLYTKIQGLRIPHIHSNLQYCFLSFLPYFCLTSHHGFEQTAEKCIIFAEEKQHSAIWKQAFIALVCIFFAEEKLHLSKIFKQAWYSAFDLHFLCTVNQWKCSGSLAGGIYYDQGRSQ